GAPARSLGRSARRRIGRSLLAPGATIRARDRRDPPHPPPPTHQFPIARDAARSARLLSVPMPLSPDAGPEAEQRLLSRYGRRFPAGSVLFRDGDAASEAFLLQEGRVRLIKHAGAMERSLRVVRPGDLFGESALVKGSLRSSTALALDDGVALAFDQATFDQVLATNPDVAARVLSQLLRRLRDAEDQIEILMLRDAQSKVVV